MTRCLRPALGFAVGLFAIPIATFAIAIIAAGANAPHAVVVVLRAGFVLIGIDAALCILIAATITIAMLRGDRGSGGGNGSTIRG